MTPPSQNKICTLIDLLEERAKDQPDKTLYTFLEDGEKELGRLSYGQLQEKVKELAAYLQAQGWEGKRALLLFPPGLDFIVAFFACLYAKVTAVPVYPPDPHRLDRTLPRLQGILRNSNVHGVLTISWIQDLAPQFFGQAPDMQKLQWVSVDGVREKGQEKDKWRCPEVDSQTLAFLQYTSGSTGDPKGVMVSHGNLVHNLGVIKQCFGLDENSIGISWLPPYHDMGLIGGILEPLYAECSTVLFSPIDFLKQPARWLKVISKYRGTTCGGPNFAYELCLKKVTEEQKASLDLSSWDMAFNGSEPIRANTLERFSEAFGSCGFRKEAFYPCYGLAEGTLIVSGGIKADPWVSKGFQKEGLAKNQGLESATEEEGQILEVGVSLIVCVSVSLCVCLSVVSLFLSACVFLSVCVSVPASFVCVFFSVCVSLRVFVFLSQCV